MTSNIKQFFLQTGLLNEEEVQIVDKSTEINVEFNDTTNNYGLNIKFVDILPVKIFEKLLDASKKQSERFEFKFSGSVKQFTDDTLNDYFVYVCKDLLRLEQQLESILNEKNVLKKDQNIIVKYFADNEKVVLYKYISNIAAYLRLAGFYFDKIELEIDKQRQSLDLFSKRKQEEIEKAIAKSKATDYEMNRLIAENRIRVANFYALNDIIDKDDNVAIQAKIYKIETKKSKTGE
ncbi:MAG: hypothetical protein HUJ68_06805 [Clostridia bacterium]|nr:hypothetical protein [Clostridia bacterium]